MTRVIVVIAVSFVGYFIIKAIKNVLHKGANAAEDAMQKAIDKKKENKLREWIKLSEKWRLA